MAGEPGGDGPYIRPRIAIATGLAVLLALLAVLDSGSRDYAMSELTLTVLLGAIVTLLGIEATDFMRRGK